MSNLLARVRDCRARSDCRATVGALLERDAPGRPCAFLGQPGERQEGPGTDFLSIFDALETKVAFNWIKVAPEFVQSFNPQS